MIIDSDGNPVVWTAKYKRYFRDYEEECESLDDAAAFLHWGEGQGAMFGSGIQCPDGRLIDGGDLRRLLYEFGEAEDAAAAKAVTT